MLDTKFYDALARLQLRMSHKSSLNVSGSRKSLRKGNSNEFSDFREYMPGDDLRLVDWNVYARLDKLYIREYMEEKEAVVSVLIDTSASMDYGAKSKAELAKDLAAVVSFLALNNMDRVLLYDMKDMGRPYPAQGGRRAFAGVCAFLEKMAFSGEIDMLACARKMRCRGAGVTVVISDFLHPAMVEEGAEKSDYERLLQYLQYNRQFPVILHTMAGEELRPALTGVLHLIDAETKLKRRLEVDARTIDSYERELQSFLERIRRGCALGRGAYVLCDTERDREKLVFEDLRVIYDI